MSFNPEYVPISQHELDKQWLRSVDLSLCVSFAKEGYEDKGRGALLIYEYSKKERESTDKALFIDYVAFTELSPLSETNDPALQTVVEQVKSYNPKKEFVFMLQRPQGITTYSHTTSPRTQHEALPQKVLFSILRKFEKR